MKSREARKAKQYSKAEPTTKGAKVLSRQASAVKQHEDRDGTDTSSDDSMPLSLRRRVQNSANRSARENNKLDEDEDDDSEPVVRHRRTARARQAKKQEQTQHDVDSGQSDGRFNPLLPLLLCVLMKYNLSPTGRVPVGDRHQIWWACTTPRYLCFNGFERRGRNGAITRA